MCKARKKLETNQSALPVFLQADQVVMPVLAMCLSRLTGNSVDAEWSMTILVIRCMLSVPTAMWLEYCMPNLAFFDAI